MMKLNKNRAWKKVLFTNSGAPTRVELGAPCRTLGGNSVTTLNRLSYGGIHYSLLSSRTNSILYRSIPVVLAPVTDQTVLDLSTEQVVFVKTIYADLNIYVWRSVRFHKSPSFLVPSRKSLPWDLETSYFIPFVLCWKMQVLALSSKLCSNEL